MLAAKKLGSSFRDLFGAAGSESDKSVEQEEEQDCEEIVLGEAVTGTNDVCNTVVPSVFEEALESDGEDDVMTRGRAFSDQPVRLEELDEYVVPVLAVAQESTEPVQGVTNARRRNSMSAADVDNHDAWWNRLYDKGRRTKEGDERRFSGKPLKECTFSPTITSKGKGSSGRRDRPTAASSAGVVLRGNSYSSDEHAPASSSFASAESAAYELRLCTFTPNITAKGRAAEPQALHRHTNASLMRAMQAVRGSSSRSPRAVFHAGGRSTGGSASGGESHHPHRRTQTAPATAAFTAGFNPTSRRHSTVMMSSSPSSSSPSERRHSTSLHTAASFPLSRHGISPAALPPPNEGVAGTGAEGETGHIRSSVYAVGVVKDAVLPTATAPPTSQPQQTGGGGGSPGSPSSAHQRRRRPRHRPASSSLSPSTSPRRSGVVSGRVEAARATPSELPLGVRTSGGGSGSGSGSGSGGDGQVRTSCQRTTTVVSISGDGASSSGTNGTQLPHSPTAVCTGGGGGRNVASRAHSSTGRDEFCCDARSGVGSAAVATGACGGGTRAVDCGVVSGREARGRSHSPRVLSKYVIDVGGTARDGVDETMSSVSAVPGLSGGVVAGDAGVGGGSRNTSNNELNQIERYISGGGGGGDGGIGRDIMCQCDSEAVSVSGIQDSAINASPSPPPPPFLSTSVDVAPTTPPLVSPRSLVRLALPPGGICAAAVAESQQSCDEWERHSSLQDGTNGVDEGLNKAQRDDLAEVLHSVNGFSREQLRSTVYLMLIGGDVPPPDHHWDSDHQEEEGGGGGGQQQGKEGLVERTSRDQEQAKVVHWAAVAAIRAVERSGIL